MCVLLFTIRILLPLMSSSGTVLFLKPSKPPPLSGMYTYLPVLPTDRGGGGCEHQRHRARTRLAGGRRCPRPSVHGKASRFAGKVCIVVVSVSGGRVQASGFHGVRAPKSRLCLPRQRSQYAGLAIDSVFCTGAEARWLIIGRVGKAPISVSCVTTFAAFSSRFDRDP